MSGKADVEFKSRTRETAEFLRKLAGLELRVGIVGPAANEIEEGTDKTLLWLGMLHEFGSNVGPGEQGYVPERSFIRRTLHLRRQDIAAMVTREMRAILAGNRSADQALQAIGMQIVAWIKKEVMEGDGIPPPLAESTIERKGSSRPLVDHGQLIARGVNYEVRKAGT